MLRRYAAPLRRQTANPLCPSTFWRAPCGHTAALVLAGSHRRGLCRLAAPLPPCATVQHSRTATQSHSPAAAHQRSPPAGNTPHRTATKQHTRRLDRGVSVVVTCVGFSHAYVIFHERWAFLLAKENPPFSHSRGGFSLRCLLPRKETSCPESKKRAVLALLAGQGTQSTAP